MGASESTDNMASREKEMREMEKLDADYQDRVFPWFHIIQWSSERIPSNVVFKWNYDDIRRDVEYLSSDPETFLVSCPKAELENFSLDESTHFLEWASVLLVQLPSLSRVRYKIVPSKIPEEQFWQRYFCGVKGIIQRQIIANNPSGETPGPVQYPINSHVQSGTASSSSSRSAASIVHLTAAGPSTDTLDQPQNNAKQ